MPVKKTAPKKKSTSSSSSSHDCCFTQECAEGVCRGYTIGHFGRKMLLTLGGILLLYGIVFLGTLIQNNIQKFQYIGQAEKQERTIVLEAEGKVEAKPNIATVSMGVTVEGETVELAQNANTEKMNALIDGLKALGIGDADIQTSQYNVYPRYEYVEESERELVAYEVSQRVTVKIRDLTTSSAILGLAGEVGATNVSGLQFTLDDREVYLADARKDAMRQLKEKAEELSRLLGVEIVGVVSYQEYESGGNSPMAYRESFSYDAAVINPASKVESGSLDIRLNVVMTLEIK